MNYVDIERRLMTMRVLIADDEQNQLELLSFNLAAMPIDDMLDDG